MTFYPGLPKGILNGVRILDFTWKTVGPWKARLLTHFGAEVIHVERADSWDDHRYTRNRSPIIEGPAKEFHSEGAPGAYRGALPSEDTGSYFATPYFSSLHNGKLAVSLNTRHPEGLELVERLIAESDGLVENFSADVLPSWGLTWERIHEINPRLVYVSTSGFGHSGEWKGYRTYGPTAAAQAGLSLASGLPGMPPAGWGYSHMDVMGGWMGGLALIMGLLQAKQTGKGMYIDHAVTEGAMSLLGPFMLDYQVNGRPTRRPDFPPGNHSIFPAIAPHNTYRCSGKDRVGQDWWVFIACETQPQFEALCYLMEQPELLLDPRFATNEARVANQDALDAIVGGWVRPRRRYEVMNLCQQKGIIAAAVQSAEDRVEYDPQLQHRGIHPVIEHPELGAFKYEGYPVKFSRTQPHLKGRGPMLREHNQYVFSDLLGLSAEELERLAAEEVILVAVTFDKERLGRLKDTVAVVGVGETDYGSDYRGDSGQAVEKGKARYDSYTLASRALKRALDDCGLSKDDIDGLCVSGTLQEERASELWGLNPRWSGGGDAAQCIIDATLAINAGLCTTVALVYGNAQRSMNTAYGGPRVTGGGITSYFYYAPWGMTSQGALYAMFFQRHKLLYGTTDEQLGAIAVAFRKHACLNPNAVMQKPLTIEDYLNAPYIAEPLRLNDYCLINDGGVAIILRRADMAKDLKQTPVLVSGFGWSEENVDATQLRPRLKDFYHQAHHDVVAQVYPMAGVSQKDVDVFATYDSFSVHLLASLEGFGFCKEGEGGAFVQDGRIEIGGELPCNTSGGMLSESYMQSWNHQPELVRQLRGGLGPRQVEGAEVAQYVHDVAGKCKSLIYTRGG